IIFIDSDDRHFALRVLDGIRCMRGVNHDRLPELLSNRTGRRLCWISRAEDVANFAHGVHSLINNGDRLFRSRRAAFFWMTFAGFFTGHKLDNALPIFAAAFWTELFLKDRQHRAVKLLRLCNAHLVNFEANDRETSARKYFNHSAGTQIWEPEIVRLNEHERF